MKRIRRPRNIKSIKNGIWFARYGTAPTAPCHWCGKPLRFKEATLDHEPPLSEGGTLTGAVLACEGCNQKRNTEAQRRANQSTT